MDQRAIVHRTKHDILKVNHFKLNFCKVTCGTSHRAGQPNRNIVNLFLKNVLQGTLPCNTFFKILVYLFIKYSMYCILIGCNDVNPTFICN